MNQRFYTLLCLSFLWLSTSMAQTSFTVCQGDSVQLSATGGDLYEWLPHTGLSDPYSATPKAAPDVTTTYTVRRLRTSGDLVRNGNFSQGSSQFTTAYKDSSWIAKEGYYLVTNNPSLHHPDMNACQDHSSGTIRNMMAVNGSSNANEVVWRQTITVTPNTNYAFSTWVNAGISGGAFAVLQFSINNNLLGSQFATRYSPCDWQQFYTTWNSGSATTATISVVNQNTSREGNDFALDDIFFQSFTVLTDQTIINVTPAGPKPVIQITGDITPCQGQSVTLTGPAGFSQYRWNDGLTSRARTESASGNFVLRTLGTNGCYSFRSDTAKVAVQPIPTALILAAGGATNVCTGDSVLLTASVAEGYLWSNGKTTQSIYAKTAGSYTVRAVSAQACSSVVSNSVSVSLRTAPRIPTITTSTSDSVLCTGGSLTLNSSYNSNNRWSTAATTQSITVTAPGTYNVYAQAGSACPSPRRYITISAGGAGTVPTITTSGATTFCQGGSVVLTSSSPTGNTWSTGANTQAITVTTTGNYSVTSNTTCGSATSAATAVTVNTLPAAPTLSPAGPVSLCSGGSVTLTSSQPFSNIWSNGATSASITVNVAGTYTVRYSDGSCQSAPSNAVLVQAGTSVPTPTLSASRSTALCQGDSVLLTSSATTGNLWSNGAATQTIKVKTAGTFSVTVSAGGCSATSSNTTVTVSPRPATPAISANGNTTFCQGDSVTLTANANSGITWSTGATISSIKVKSTGSYTVSVSNGTCSATSLPTSITVNARPATPVVVAGGSTAVCPGDSVRLTSSSATGNLWSNGKTSQIIFAKTAGSYSVRVASNGCQSGLSNLVSVSINTAPAAPTVSASGPLALCPGLGVTLTSSSASGNVWSNGATTQAITVTAAGSYTVRTVSGSCQSPASAAALVTRVNAPATPTVTVTGQISFCTGGSATLISSAASGNIWSNGATTQSISVTTTGQYSVRAGNGTCFSAASTAISVTARPLPAQPTIALTGQAIHCANDPAILTSSVGAGNLWSTGATTASITPTQSGIYTVRVIDNGCTSAVSASQQLQVNPRPAQPTITASGPVNICQGQTVDLTASTADNYLWSNGSGDQTITVGQSGTITVQAFSAAGCTSLASAAITITVSSPPIQPTITSSGSTTFCQGDSVVLSASGTGNNLWSTGATTPSITVFTVGSFSVQTIAGACTSAASAATVTALARPAQPLTVVAQGPTSFCAGGSVQLIASTTGPVRWSNGGTNATLAVTASGSYTVTYDSAGCASQPSVPVVVTVNAIPLKPVISARGPVSFCTGGSVRLVSSASQGNIWTTADVGDSITVSQSGSYSVVSIINGCSSPASEPVVVTVGTPAPKPTIAASSATTFCAGDSLVLSSSATSGNQWSTGAITNSITVRTSGQYSVRVGSGACASPASDSTRVVVNALPAAPSVTASGTTRFCQGDSVILTSSSPRGNLWSNGDTTPRIVVRSTGSYSLRVTNGNCLSPTSIVTSVIVDAPLATPTITASGNLTLCAGDSMTLTSSAAFGNLWSNTDTSQSITIRIGGTYTVRQVGSFCTSPASAALLVVVNPTPAVPIISILGSTTLCQGDSVTLESSALAGNRWSTGDTSRSIRVLTGGSYSVAAQLGACRSAASTPQAITVNPIPARPTITASGRLSLCPGDSLTLTSSATVGNFWSNTATTPQIVVNAAGTYSVTVLANGCRSAASEPVVAVAGGVPTIATITQFGDSLFASGSNGVRYGWTLNGSAIGDTTSNIRATLNGQYCVTAYSSGGCSATSTQSCFSFIRQSAKTSLPGVKLSLVPNPAKGHVRLDLSGAALAGPVYPIDGLGRMLSAIMVDQDGKVDISALPSGLYTLQVLTSKGALMTRLMISGN